MKKRVAERIRLLRLSRNLSQENMADELGISIGAYSNIERGVTDITVTGLQQLADIFSVSPQDLLNPDKNILDQQVNDPGKDYGYASKEEVAELRKAVSLLKSELKKLRQELLPRK